MAGSRVSFSQPSNLSIVLLLLVNGKVFFSNREIITEKPVDPLNKISLRFVKLIYNNVSCLKKINKKRL